VRALVRTAIVIVLGAGLVLGATHFPDRRWHLAGSGATTGTGTGSNGSGPGGAAADVSSSSAPRLISQSALVCSGPETVGVKGVDGKTAVVPSQIRAAAPPSDLVTGALGAAATGSAAVTGAGSVSAAAIGGSGPVGFTSLTAPGVASTVTSAARSVVLSGHGSLAPGLAALQTSLVTSGDLRGLSTSACQAPSAETWLVGGSDAPGRRGRIILTNPTPNGVTVELDVYGAKGRLIAAAGRGLVVGAHRRKVVLLDALAPGERSPVVHVIATGGVVSAVLADTWLDNTTPAGTDDVVGAAPAKHLVVPGVTFRTPGITVLRVAATSAAASVQVRVLSPTGPTAAPVGNGVVQVPAHTVKDIDLSSVPPGNDALELTSTAPVVAGVLLAPGAPGVERDLAWTAATPSITDPAGLAGFPLGPTVTPAAPGTASPPTPWTYALFVTAAAQDSTVQVETVAADGTPTSRQVVVAAGTTTTVPLTGPAVSGWLRVVSGSVNAALYTSYADPSGVLLSVAPLRSVPLRTVPVAVHPLAG
jgi:hypothetical protein